MLPRRFALIRHVDYTGGAGTGVIAYGVAFDDGQVVLRWSSAHRATSVLDSVEDLIAAHGHGETTSIEWIDAPPGEADAPAQPAPVGRRARRPAQSGDEQPAADGPDAPEQQPTVTSAKPTDARPAPKPAEHAEPEDARPAAQASPVAQGSQAAPAPADAGHPTAPAPAPAEATPPQPQAPAQPAAPAQSPTPAQPVAPPPAPALAASPPAAAAQPVPAPSPAPPPPAASPPAAAEQPAAEASALPSPAPQSPAGHEPAPEAPTPAPTAPRRAAHASSASNGGHRRSTEHDTTPADRQEARRSANDEHRVRHEAIATQPMNTDLTDEFEPRPPRRAGLPAHESPRSIFEEAEQPARPDLRLASSNGTTHNPDDADDSTDETPARNEFGGFFATGHQHLETVTGLLDLPAGLNKRGHDAQADQDAVASNRNGRHRDQ